MFKETYQRSSYYKSVLTTEIIFIYKNQRQYACMFTISWLYWKCYLNLIFYDQNTTSNEERDRVAQ